MRSDVALSTRIQYDIPMRYADSYKLIEEFAKNFWQEHQTDLAKEDNTKAKEVVLDFFPYPSGIGLHIGHTLGFIATDVYARYQRLQGKSVLFAMGFDSFGLPAEQFAIETGVHPEITTKRNIANMEKQLRILGLSHDTTRTFSTTDKEYYRWTQWIFMQLYNSYFDEAENKALPITHLEQKIRSENPSYSDDEIYAQLQQQRLAYLTDVEVNWCPKLGTVLADEEVIGGKSERGNYPVVRKLLKQWVLRITKYAERLQENLDALNWPDSLKEMQRNWIGVSHGHEITFQNAENHMPSLTVYTTRADTLMSVTFCAISIKHPAALDFCVDPDAKKEVSDKLAKIIKEESHKSELGDEFGIFTGAYVIHPVSQERLPVYIADYILPYGTCAVMGVPAYDERDCNFAKRYVFGCARYVEAPMKKATKGSVQYIHVQSTCGPLKGGHGARVYIGLKGGDGARIQQEMHQDFPTELINVDTIAHEPWIVAKTYSKIRDWIFSRQRYWGEPFPIVLDAAGKAYALEESCLPVELPVLEDFQAVESQDIAKPLDKLSSWKNVNFVKLDLNTVRIVPNHVCEKIMVNGVEKIVEAGTRETNTMPNWAGSCWYYLRYTSVDCADRFVDKAKEKYWAGDQLGFVDLYLGGAEHAVLHLLYARFWHLVLYDLGYVTNKEPFNRLFNQGMILGASYRTEEGKYFAPADVYKKDGSWFVKNTNEPLIESIGKIGKRYKNGVPPEEVCDVHGVDALRLYMMYLGPLEQSKPWDYTAIKGMSRLLEKVCALQIEDCVLTEEVAWNLNETIKKMGHDIQNLRFNTAISSFIILLNTLNSVPKDVYKQLLVLLAPFAPHVCEYLYHKNFESVDSIFAENWPEIKNLQRVLKSINVVFTFNGKKKFVAEFSADVTDAELEDHAAKNIADIKKVIVVRAEGIVKLVNVVG